MASIAFACALIMAALFLTSCRTNGNFFGNSHSVSARASVDAQRTAIFCSVYYGDKRQVTYLLETLDKNVVNQKIGPVGALYTSCLYSTAFTPLFLAVWQGDVDMVRLLIEHGGSANHELSDVYRGLTMLSCCVSGSIKANRYTIASVLLSAGASPNVVYDGHSLIEHAVLYGDSEFVRILLANGADPNVAHDREGNTPLHVALYNRMPLDMVKPLVGAGASLKRTNIWGNTPLHTALIHTAAPETIRLLVESGADINALTVFGDSPLDLAEDDATREYLRQRGARPGKGLDPDQRKALADEILKKFPAAGQ